ncbi:MAG: hypothetical protein ACJAR2_000123 [Ilumatobacter sp.]
MLGEPPDIADDVRELSWADDWTQSNNIVADNLDFAGRPVLIKGNSRLLFRDVNRLSDFSVSSACSGSRSRSREVLVGLPDVIAEPTPRSQAPV